MRSLRTVRHARPIVAVLAAVGAGVLLAGCASSATPAASSTPTDAATSADATSADVSSADVSSAEATSEAPSSGAPSSDNSSEMVSGFVWVSDTVTGQDLVPDSQIVITQTEDRISVNAGCNGMNGTVVDNGDSWEVGPLASTMMACDEALMAQDAWVGEFLEAGPTVERSDAGLTLTSGDVSITFTERMAPSLVDTVWTLDGIITADAVSSLPLDAKPAELTITDGQLSLAGICNGTGGDVTIEGDTLTVVLGMSTLMSCGEEVDAAEQHARAVLEGDSTYVINDQVLTITSGDGTGLQFTAAGPALPDDMETMPSVTDALETFPESPMTSTS